MNAVIVDIRKKQAAALDESGRIVRIHNAGYEIGQRIELHEVKPVRSAKAIKRFSSGVAAAVLLAMIGTGTVYAMPYGTVTLEGEPSIEYTINCFDYVLDVQATNEDGEALLAEIDMHQLRHHRVDHAVTVTMEQLEHDGHIDGAEAPIRISSETRNDGHTERLRQRLEPIADRGGHFAAPESERIEDHPQHPIESGVSEAPPEEPMQTEPFHEPQEFDVPPESQNAGFEPDRPQPEDEPGGREPFANQADNSPPRDFENLPGDAPAGGPDQRQEAPASGPGSFSAPPPGRG